MTKSIPDIYRTLLHDRRKHILDIIEQLRSISQVREQDTESLDRYSTHIADQGSDSMGREESFMLISRELEYLARIDDALRNIDKGQYGKCKICGKRIPHERLMAVPTTDTCVTCKTFKKSEFSLN